MIQVVVYAVKPNPVDPDKKVSAQRKSLEWLLETYPNFEGVTDIRFSLEHDMFEGCRLTSVQRVDAQVIGQRDKEHLKFVLSEVCRILLSDLSRSVQTKWNKEVEELIEK